MSVPRPPCKVVLLVLRSREECRPAISAGATASMGGLAGRPGGARFALASLNTARRIEAQGSGRRRVPLCDACGCVVAVTAAAEAAAAAAEAAAAEQQLNNHHQHHHQHRHPPCTPCPAPTARKGRPRTAAAAPQPPAQRGAARRGPPPPLRRAAVGSPRRPPRWMPRTPAARAPPPAGLQHRVRWEGCRGVQVNACNSSGHHRAACCMHLPPARASHRYQPASQRKAPQPGRAKAAPTVQQRDVQRGALVVVPPIHVWQLRLVGLCHILGQDAVLQAQQQAARSSCVEAASGGGGAGNGCRAGGGSGGAPGPPAPPQPLGPLVAASAAGAAAPHPPPGPHRAGGCRQEGGRGGGGARAG